MDNISLLIAEIKKKKSISQVKDSFVLKEIEKILAQDRRAREKLASADPKKVAKSAEFKAIVKQVRAVLHRSHGQYQTDELPKREKYLEELKQMMVEGRIRSSASATQRSHPPPPTSARGVLKLNQNTELLDEKMIALHSKILSTNISAKERRGLYPSIYREIFAITGSPKSILDIGSGINPVSFPFMGLSGIKYTALELSEKDCDFLVQYFTLMERFVDAKAEPVDLVEIKKNPDLLKRFKADIAFIFKVIEPLELNKSHKIGEQMIEAVKANWIVVSFATKTISGKPMNHPRRGWFEMMLKRLGHEYRIIEKENEIFYVIRKDGTAGTFN